MDPFKKMKVELNARGWRQGFHVDSREGFGIPEFGPICLGEAAYAATDEWWVTQKVITVLAETTDPDYDGPFPIGRVIDWNDVPGRTFQEVIDLIDRAAAQAAA